VACLEEIAWKNGLLTRNDIKKISDEMPMNIYRKYLRSLLTD